MPSNPWIPILAAALIIGMFGEVMKKLVGAKPGDPGLKGVYIVTYKVHALIVGALMGLGGSYIGLPVPEVFGTALGGSVLAYTASGGVAMVGYSSIVGTIKSTLAHIGAKKD